jgi:hypothetical protein
MKDPSRFGVEVVGLDLTLLDRRREMPDAIEGWATLTGTWTHDRLFATQQQPHSSLSAQHMPKHDRPPCPMPPGGWPESFLDENIDVLQDDLDPFAITAVALFRPSRRHVVLVLAAEDSTAVDAALRPKYGARLCVVPSRWSGRQIDDVLRRLRAEVDAWQLYSFGPATAHDGQPFVSAQVTRVGPELVAWAQSIPDGLLTVDPWLAPLS